MGRPAAVEVRVTVELLGEQVLVAAVAVRL
jgi:hypothetical protein